MNFKNLYIYFFNLHILLIVVCRKKNVLLFVLNFFLSKFYKKTVKIIGYIFVFFVHNAISFFVLKHCYLLSEHLGSSVLKNLIIVSATKRKGQNSSVLNFLVRDINIYN